MLLWYKNWALVSKDMIETQFWHHYNANTWQSDSKHICHSSVLIPGSLNIVPKLLFDTFCEIVAHFEALLSVFLMLKPTIQ